MTTKTRTRKRKKATGRPEYQPTRVDRERVELWAAQGVDHGFMARELRIARNTLTKHFGDELAYGRQRQLSEEIERLKEQSRGGKTAATKALIGILSQQQAAREPSQQAKVPRLGKKEVQQLQAEHPDQTSPMGELMARRLSEGTPTVQ